MKRTYSLEGKIRWSNAQRRTLAKYHRLHPSGNTVRLRRAVERLRLAVVEYESEVTEPDGRLSFFDIQIMLPDGRLAYVDIGFWRSREVRGRDGKQWVGRRDPELEGVLQRKRDYCKANKIPLCLVTRRDIEGMQMEIAYWLLDPDERSSAWKEGQKEWRNPDRRQRGKAKQAPAEAEGPPPPSLDR